MVALPDQSIATGSETSAAAAPLPEPVQLVLEITRGRTRFPARPVTNSRFLIGAGVTCDLRLGASDIPAIHSILTIQGGEVHLEAIHPVPALVVNGKTVRETAISDGDAIAIGEVELRARMSVGHGPLALQAAAGPNTALETHEASPADLSAVELINRIEAEERMIDEFDDRRRAGAKSLTQALLSRVNRKVEEPEESVRKRAVPAPHFLSKRPQVLAARGRGDTAAPTEVELQSELEQLGRQLAALSQELKQNALRASAREAEFASTTDLLLDTQQKLMSRFESLMSHVEQLQQQKQSPMNRAIA